LDARVIDEFMDACFEGADEVRLEAFQDFIVRLNEEIILLKLALADKRSAIASISTATRVVCFAACLFVACIIVFKLSLAKVMVLASSWLVSSILVVGPSVRDVLDGIVFVFVRHPYDIGDFVEVDKEVYLVDSVGLLSTVFLYKRRITSIPNKGLAGAIIVNLSRTTFTETFSVLVRRPVHVDDRIASYLQAHKALWEPDTYAVAYANAEHCPCVRLTVVVNCKYPFENRVRNSNKLFEFLYGVVGERCGCWRVGPSIP
jgi:small-conductance mechanosensitive channel